MRVNRRFLTASYPQRISAPFSLCVIRIWLSMPKSYADAQKEVKRNMKGITYKRVVEVGIKKGEKNMWGLSKGKRLFDKQMLIALLYKWKEGVGNNALQVLFKDWVRLSNDSFNNNMKIISRHLGNWGREMINSKANRGTLDDWNRTASTAGLRQKVKDGNLWIDSSDFRVTGKRTTKKKTHLGLINVTPQRSDLWESLMLKHNPRGFTVVTLLNFMMPTGWKFELIS